MKPIFFAALAAATATFGLSACSSTGAGLGSGEVTKQILGNLEHCKRTYTGQAGGFGAAQIAVHIECEPAAPAVWGSPLAEPLP